MKNSAVLITLLISAVTAFAQIPPPCVDSLRVNPYHTCYLSYDPVCGCDSNTHRNYCFAYSKMGVNYWRTGICGSENFDIDIVPVPVQLEPLTFSAAFRKPSNCLVYIIDVFCHEVFRHTFYTSYNDEIVNFEIQTNGFQDGVYTLIAVVNGEFKYEKILKVKY
jgi:hypothetical protein